MVRHDYVDCVGGLIKVSPKEELPISLISPIMLVVIIQSDQFILSEAIYDSFNSL